LFARGMVAEVWCNVRYFLDNADAILQAAPVEVICLRRITHGNVKELARRPAFARVLGVKFLMDETPAEIVCRFFEAVPAGGLVSVTLDKRTINSMAPTWHTRNVALATALAGCTGFRNLKRLFLSHGGVGDEGALALARSPHLSGLELLDLSHNALGPEVEAALRQRFGRALILGREDHRNFTLGELGVR
jgi:hypothetical protein